MILNIFLTLYTATVLFVLIKNVLSILDDIKNNNAKLSNEIVNLKSLFPESIGLVIVCLIIAIVIVAGSICWPFVIWWNMHYGDNNE